MICVTCGREIESFPGLRAAVSARAVRCRDVLDHLPHEEKRGHDLAYLTTLPSDQARARRFVHETVDSDIAVARMVGASQREGRRERRKLPKVKPMKTAPRSA